MNYLKAHAISGNMLCLVFSSLMIFFNCHLWMQHALEFYYWMDWNGSFPLIFSPDWKQKKMSFQFFFLAFAFSNQQHIVQLMHIKSKIIFNQSDNLSLSWNKLLNSDTLSNAFISGREIYLSSACAVCSVATLKILCLCILLVFLQSKC